MNGHTLLVAAHAHPRAVVLLGAVAGAWLLVLRVRSRVSRARLSRAVARSFTPDRPRRRSSARAEHRMLARSVRSRRATRRFRKAALLSALLSAAWLYAQLHPHTR